MQQQICIPTTTAIAQARIAFAQAAVVTNAAAHTFREYQHAVPKCSDPGKPGRGASDRWRVSGMSRGWLRPSTPPVRVPVSRVAVPRVVRGSALMSDLAMPPSLWASWVLSQSLCG